MYKQLINVLRNSKTYIKYYNRWGKLVRTFSPTGEGGRKVVIDGSRRVRDNDDDEDDQGEEGEVLARYMKVKR
jgi:hypothetical protein